MYLDNRGSSPRTERSKIISIPIFWILNALGTLVSGIAIKKGYATELAKGRIMTLALLIGMIIGYIIGNLIPLQ